MSLLKPSVQILDKGLNLQTAKLVAPPGSVLDSMNYEQVDFQGQKRIDGFTRYDGSPLSALDEVVLLDTAGSGITVESHSPYSVVLNNGVAFGIVVLDTEVEGRTPVAVFDYQQLTFADSNDAVWAKKLLTEEEHLQLLLDCNQYLRDRVESLPGPISGLHWFRDRLYAVSDIQTYTPDDPRIDTASNASLFESRSVSQVLADGDDDFGWRFVHQGWHVNFSNGKSSFGSFPAVNQNLKGVGTQGPTSTSGTNGTFKETAQGSNIQGFQQQVSGWKNSNRPDAYAVSPTNLKELDNLNIYADAFFSWKEGEYTSPAPTDALVQYTPTSSVEVNV